MTGLGMQSQPGMAAVDSASTIYSPKSKEQTREGEGTRITGDMLETYDQYANPEYQE